MTKTIRWGIIGVGDVTEVKSGPGFQLANNSELVAVMRRDGDKARDYAERHNVPKWTDDADALINDPDVDAVYIATPPHVHKQYTLAVAAAGKPVYVEKPMALNFSECQEMIRACDEAGVPLWVAYYRRALPRFLRVKQLLEEGSIGEPRFVSVRIHQPARSEMNDPDNLPWRVQPEIAGGGIFVDLASHTFDFLDFMLGPITQVKGHASNQAGQYEAEDTVTASFIHESGVQGVGVWCFDGYRDEDLVEIAGTKGSLTFSSFGVEPIILATGSRSEKFVEETPAHIQQPLIQSIVDELNGADRCPSTGVSGARTSWVMDQILADYYT